MRRPRLAATFAATLVALALAGCGTAQPACAVTGDEPPVPGPSSNDDPELRDRFPETLGGEPLDMVTVCATHAGSGGLTTDPAFLDALGVELEDVTVAIGPTPEIGATDGYVSIMAWRYRGVDEDRLRDEFVEGLRGVGTEPVESQTGGKGVHEALGGYYYVADDALYAISGDPAGVEELLQALP